MPSHSSSRISSSSPPGTFRAGSVSSIRRSSQSPNVRLATALRALPTWRDPVGLGAKRTRFIAQNLTVAAILRRADAALGDRLERLLVAHHRRRLRRLGQLGALDAPAAGWAAGEPPPRRSNTLEVLVDGAVALPEIAAAIEG